MNELQITYTGAVTNPSIVALIQSGAQFWNTSTSAFEAYDPANVALYATAPFTQVSTTPEYVGSMPSNIPGGKYRVSSYIKAGSSLATSDLATGKCRGTDIY